MVSPILTVTLDGADIEAGRVPVNELINVLRYIQLSIKRIGQVISEGESSSSSGRAKANIEDEYELDVVTFESGSFVAGLIPHSYGRPQQHLMMSAGEEAISLLVEGVRTIDQEPERFVKTFDAGVLAALSSAAKVLDRGVSAIKLSYNSSSHATQGGEQAESLASFIDFKVRDKIEHRLSIEVLPTHRITGVLREANFDRKTCQIFESGKKKPTNCTFPEELREDVLRAMEKNVTVFGEAQTLGGSGHNINIRQMNIKEIQIVEQSQPVASNSPAAPYSLITVEDILNSGLEGSLQEYASEIGDTAEFVRRNRR